MCNTQYYITYQMVDLPDFKYDFCEVIRAVWIRLENNLCHFIKSLIEKIIQFHRHFWELRIICY